MNAATKRLFINPTGDTPMKTKTNVKAGGLSWTTGGV